MKPSKLFCFKDTRRYSFFLAAGIKISQRANATAIRVWCKWIHPTIGWRRDEQGTHKHTRGSWILFYMITRSLVNNAFSVLHYVIKVTLHYLIRYIASGFILLGTFAHGFITESNRGWSAGVAGLKRDRGGGGKEEKIKDTCHKSPPPPALFISVPSPFSSWLSLSFLR